MRKIGERLSILIISLAGTTFSWGSLIITEDFESGITGSAFPGTDANGQGGWVTLEGATTIRNDFQNGSLDGNVYYTGVNGGGKGYRHDGVSYVSATDSSIQISFSGRVGGAGASVDRWSRAGVAHYDGTNVNPGLYFGSFGTLWGVALGAGTGAGSTLATSTDAFPGDWEIHDMRLTVDLISETATFEHNAGTGWLTPTGMSNFDASALNTGAADGSNPFNWNSLYFRGIASGDTIDNIVVNVIPEPSPAALLLLGFGLLAAATKRL